MIDLPAASEEVPQRRKDTRVAFEFTNNLHQILTFLRKRESLNALNWLVLEYALQYFSNLDKFALVELEPMFTFFCFS